MAQPVQARGQITLPIEIRRSAGIAPGVNVVVSVIGPGEIRIKSIKPLTLQEILEKYPPDEGSSDLDVEEEIDKGLKAVAEEY